MTKRPLIRWRIGLIFIVGLLAVLLVPIALFYAARGIDRATSLPQPRQLAAIVALVEDTAPSQRTALFEAMRSTQISLRVAPEAEVFTNLRPFWPDDQDRIADYQSLLGDRDFAAYAVRRQLFNGGFLNPLAAAEFRVALKEGGVLILAVEGLVMFTCNGVPIGFPAAFLGIVVAFVALVLLNGEFRSVLRLARAVEDLDPVDANASLPKIRAGTAEVRALIEAFDRQQRRVATLLRARSTLVGGIQNDVRTFATRLRLRVEKMPDPRDRAQAEADIKDLVALMDSALLATRSEAGKLDQELIDVVGLLEPDLLDRQRAGAPVSFHRDTVAEGAQILGDRLALRRVVANLVDNAIRYGDTAHVSVLADENTLTILVDDRGKGIPSDQRQDLLEPFVRQEPSRSRETGGAGLGLAIVSTLVNGHKGKLTIGDAPTGGARMAVQLPRFRPD